MQIKYLHGSSCALPLFCADCAGLVKNVALTVDMLKIKLYRLRTLQHMLTSPFEYKENLISFLNLQLCFGITIIFGGCVGNVKPLL